MSTPYIGSKISLISRSEIRYEGILYTVDPQEATIALAKVRTFGTEDRVTDHPTPARDEIFEYIIFKASDIKDIVVCETPQPVPQLCGGLPYDPAIVSVSKNQQLAANQQSGGADAQPTAKPAGSRDHSPLNRSGSPAQQHSSSTNLQNRAPGAGRRESGGHGGYQQQRKSAWGQPNDAIRRPANENNDFDERHQQQRHFQQQNVRGDNLQNQTQGAFRSRGPYRRGNSNNNGAYLRGAGGYRGGAGGFIPRGGPNAYRGGGAGGNRERFEADYDFETANETFQETISQEFATKAKLDESSNEGSLHNAPQLAAEAAADEQQEVNRSYDKAKSFFDKISCEALERLENSNSNNRSSNWRRERDLNTETFGQSGVRNNYYNPRGYGNQRGGYYRRGGGQGYGGGYGGGNRDYNGRY